MSTAQARANQQLYFAALLREVLARELERGELPAAAVRQAVGEGARRHLQDAYGWYLLALSENEELPPHPPRSAAELLRHSRGSLGERGNPLNESGAGQGGAEPGRAGQSAVDQPPLMRGELVELAALEQRPGWLRDLLGGGFDGEADAESLPPSPPAPGGDIPLRGESPWTVARLQSWQAELTNLMDRMNDSLAEC